jgi:nicotinamide riboside kinase
LRTAEEVSSTLNGMVSSGNAACAAEAFPSNWNDRLRPFLQGAITSIREDVLVLTRVNLEWDDAFTKWEPIAAGLGPACTN